VQDDGTDNISYSIKVKDSNNYTLSVLVPQTSVSSPNTINYDVTLNDLIVSNKIIVEIIDGGTIVIDGYSGAMVSEGMLGMFNLYSYTADFTTHSKVKNIAVTSVGY